MSYQEATTTQRSTLVRPISWGVAGVMLLIVLMMWGCPHYNVFSARKDGEAQLAHAQSSKEVAVAEARAKAESAAWNAAADTVRAHGIARSNQIIGASLKNNPEYLHWLWIDNIEKNPQAVIYVPTEANLPILETNRLSVLQRQRELEADTEAP